MNFKSILKIVAQYYNVEEEDICSEIRKKDIVKARQIICYLARKELNKSYPFIGKRIGNRDHTTIIHAFKKMEVKIEGNDDFKNEIETITKLIEKGDVDIKGVTQKNIISNIANLLKDKFSLIQLQRQNDILEKYKDGWTYTEIGEKYKLTRERIRQIVSRGLIYRACEIWGKDVNLYFEGFLKKEKHDHLLKLKERKGVTKKTIPIKEKKWSRYYDYCRKCATTIIKHHSYGFCKRCYPNSELFKKMQRESRFRNLSKRKKKQVEYLKQYKRRPDVIAKIRRINDLKNYDGNRAKALMRDNYKCRICRLSQGESFKKFKKDLYVRHIDDKNDHRLENLITLCKNCFNRF